jgi:ABC-2 type transport system permease protein
MHKIWALIRASWLVASSYKMGFVFSFGSLVLSVVPIFFVTGALQSTMANAIRGQGDQYFAFLIVGLIGLQLVSTTIFAVPGALQSATSTGTLEALLATPTPIVALLAGLSGYEVLLSALRGLVMLLAATLLGAHVAWSQLGASIPIMALLILAHLPVGIITAAMVLAFRARGPLAQLVYLSSTFLGGVYYPTTVIPGWIQSLSAFLPITYALRALRSVLIEGRPITSVGRELGVLVLFTTGLMIVSTVAFRAAMRYARRIGNLAQY